MKLNLIIITLFISLLAGLSQAESGQAAHVVKVKKHLGQNANLKNVKKIGSDDQYDYYEVSEEEMKLIIGARILYEKSRGLPPPSKHMQNKMQDQVGPAEEP